MLGTYKNVTIIGSLETFPNDNMITGRESFKGNKKAAIMESEIQNENLIFSPRSTELLTEA
jgi:hypothetical protein